ncbi:C40 family peptidase [Streptomyces sp. AV19]|uniref:C40 family peptidase n=1 Tax=Streptomyces sp. AV19 TaxID=2793068 RepID=UPI0018FE269D|nr:C40 family peptidase [Streptomyces sp. AV19]MBH1936175.1 C40 family peptidase [Streptomyces sp. AV19]MDG4534637.1 NlpC/P60 family protein [Streptomyces sp. AV19]
MVGRSTGGGDGAVRRPPHARRVLVATALVCAAVAAVPQTAWADPAPPKRSLEDVHKEVESLYRKAEAATDAYNAADEQAKLQEKNATGLAKKVADAEKRRREIEDRIGELARSQYRSGGLAPSARLFLAPSPDDFLAALDSTRRGQDATRRLLAETESVKEELGRYAKAADERWKRLKEERKKKADAKKEIEARLDAARKLESRLEDAERERLKKLEEEKARRAQQQWLASDAVKGLSLKDSAGSSTDAGRRAVEFATAQMGKNYVWGAVGPDTYDCSGLTSRAWATAGRPIPRTSQEQWRQLPKVEVKDMRPGDLIIYFSDASHVAMYIGDGTMVHAPRPGRQVTLAGAGSMPVLGVVRPG